MIILTLNKLNIIILLQKLSVFILFLYNLPKNIVFIYQQVPVTIRLPNGVSHGTRLFIRGRLKLLPYL